MTERVTILFCLVLTLFILCAGCSQPPDTVTELKRYQLDDMDGIISRTNVAMDRTVSSDGNGSLRITVNQPTTICIFETGAVDAHNARLTYQAKVRTEGLEGRAYLEMWCQFTGRGEFYSRGLASPVSGTANWSSQEIPFFLQKNQKPDNVKLNLVIDGKGTVWIDDIRLFKASL